MSPKITLNLPAPRKAAQERAVFLGGLGAAFKELFRGATGLISIARPESGKS